MITVRWYNFISDWHIFTFIMQNQSLNLVFSKTRNHFSQVIGLFYVAAEE